MQPELKQKQEQEQQQQQQQLQQQQQEPPQKQSHEPDRCDDLLLVNKQWLAPAAPLTPFIQEDINIFVVCYKHVKYICKYYVFKCFFVFVWGNGGTCFL